MFPNDTTIIVEIRSNATILNYLSSLIEIQGNQQVINTYAEATVQHCRVRLDQPDMCRLAFWMRSAAVATERGRGKQWARARSAWSGKPPVRRAACCIGIFRSSCRCRRGGAYPAPCYSYCGLNIDKGTVQKKNIDKGILPHGTGTISKQINKGKMVR